MTRSTWTLALLAAVGVVLYRQSRSSSARNPSRNLAGSQDLDLPPPRHGVVTETMWTPSDPTEAAIAPPPHPSGPPREP